MPTCFDTEVSELPAVAPPPLEKRKPFHIALKCQQCASEVGAPAPSDVVMHLGPLSWQRYGQCSHVFLIPRCEICQMTWPWVKGSVGLGPGQVIPGGTEFMVLDTVVVDGYFKLLKLSSEGNHIGLRSLAETSVKKMKRESLGDT